jgi:hypothetical protein
MGYMALICLPITGPKAPSPLPQPSAGHTVKRRNMDKGRQNSYV